MANELKCIHTWGPGPGCDGMPAGLLCYSPRDEAIPRVDLSCDKFLSYHDHHGGIAVLLAWKLNGITYEQIKAELKEKRGRFQQEMQKEFDSNTLPAFVSQRKTIEEGTMKAYDSLVRLIDAKSR